jgi:hypothetical protein
MPLEKLKELAMATELATKPGYREFNALKSDGTRVKLSVRLPHQKELQYADIEMSVAFNRAQEASLPVRSRLLRKLKANGQWSDQDQIEMDALRDKLKLAQSTFRDLTAAKTKSEAADNKDTATITARIAEAAEVLDKARQAFGERVNEFNSMTQHTADEKSDVAYRNYLIACVTEYASDAGTSKKGSRLFGTLEDLLNSNDPTLFERLIYEFQACQNNMPSEWTIADELEEKLKTTEELTAASDAKAGKQSPITDEKTVVDTEPQPEANTEDSEITATV